nr:type IV secretion system protein [Caulobacter sp. 17J80-11]
MALSPQADQTVASALAAVDCQLNGAVATSYARLFGASGAFTGVLTALLTVFVAWIGYGLITGRTRLSLPAMTPKLAALALVLTFATAWPAYQAVVYGLLTGGPDELASALAGARGGAAQVFAARLDGLFDGVVEIGRALDVGQEAGLQGASQLVWSAAMVLLLSTLGLLVVARVVLAVLLAVGPVFVVLGLFSGTRPLFEGWLRTALGFAFAPMLVVLGGFGALNLMGPLIQAIAEDPLAAAREMRPLVTLLVAALIYAGVLVALAWAALNLTRGWRLGGRTGAARTPPTAPAHQPAPALATPGADAGGSDASASARLSALVTAVLREPASAPARVEIVRSVGGEAGGASPPSSSRRTEGLGRSFRPTAAARMLTGAPGS